MVETSNTRVSGTVVGAMPTYILGAGEALLGARPSQHLCLWSGQQDGEEQGLCLPTGQPGSSVLESSWASMGRAMVSQGISGRDAALHTKAPVTGGDGPAWEAACWGCVRHV